MYFDKSYSSIGFKPVGNSSRKFREITPVELSKMNIKNYDTVDQKMVKDLPRKEKHEAVAACLRSSKKDIFVTKSVVVHAHI